MIGLIFQLCNDDITKLEGVLNTSISDCYLWIRWKIQRSKEK